MYAIYDDEMNMHMCSYECKMYNKTQTRKYKKKDRWKPYFSFVLWQQFFSIKLTYVYKWLVGHGSPQVLSDYMLTYFSRSKKTSL